MEPEQLTPALTLDAPSEDRGRAVAQYAPGSALGRFRITAELGAGGMGVVLEAYDATLQRHVALKMLRREAVGATAAARLLHEAQAMARLSHPHVVSVYGVEPIGDALAIVMERVRGQTLASWLATARSWREVLGVFLQAGEGLAAAHAAGLIHRDFKPSNALIDEDGRVRVSDFGLASSDERAPLAEGSPEPAVPRRPAGTPRYMAPEQAAGREVDARADQYALALCLSEALEGQRVPRRVRSALTRALAEDRQHRFESIGELLRELRRALGARRRSAIAALAGGTALALAGAVWSLDTGAADPCVAGAGLVDELWTPSARAELAARFTAARPLAATDAVTRSLDEWAAAWRLGRKSACQAPLRERPARLGCLDRSLGELRAQLAQWSRADARAVDRALLATAELPAAAECASVSQAHAVSPAIEQRVAALLAAKRAGRAAAVEPQLVPLLGEAASSPQALARAALAVGMVQRELGQLEAARKTLTTATLEAGKATDDRTLLAALLEQAGVITEQGRPQDAIGVIDAAAAVAARAHLPATERIGTERGIALSNGGHYREAVAELERVRPDIEARASRGDAASELLLAEVLGKLAAARSYLDELPLALALIDQASALEQRLLGAQHPEHGKTLHDRGQYLARLKRWDEAIFENRRAHAIFVAAYGPTHRLALGAEISRGGMDLQRGDNEAARRQLRPLAATLATALQTSDPYVEVVENMLGTLEYEAGDYRAAVPHLRRVVASKEQGGRIGAELAFPLVTLASCLAKLGHVPEATATVNRANELLEREGMPIVERHEGLALAAELEAEAGRKANAARLLGAVVAELEPVYREYPAPQRYERFLTEARKKIALWSR